MLLASPLHQVEVRNLATPTAAAHTFPTIDLVESMEHSPVGRYLATLERTAAGETAVRVYLNWWDAGAAARPMRARIAGRVSPGREEAEPSLEMVSAWAGKLK